MVSYWNKINLQYHLQSELQYDLSSNLQSKVSSKLHRLCGNIVMYWYQYEV